MFKYIPAQPEPRLVVVLHGGTPTAARLPQQKPANNPHRWYTWFLAGDIERDNGEALSIRQMVEAMVRDHDIDRGRVFVAGLSAGGAMTSVMPATYPETFAAGGIVAGLPYRGVEYEGGPSLHVEGQRSLPPANGVTLCVPRRRTAGRGRGYRCGTARRPIGEKGEYR